MRWARPARGYWKYDRHPCLSPCPTMRWAWTPRRYWKYDRHPCLSPCPTVRWPQPARGFWNSTAVGRAFHLSLEAGAAETLALSVGLALVLGVFPVYGCPTLLCAAAAIVLRLNLPAMQLVNALATPLQLALLIPFHRLGDWLLPGVGAADPRVPAGVHAEAWRFLDGIWTLALHAVAGWFCVCAPLGILLYLILRYAGRLRQRGALFNRKTIMVAPLPAAVVVL
jgi:uncharacterized protein (DUF2062 family)